MDKRITHLQLIQGVIGRMEGSSFYAKGWAVFLVVAFFAVPTKDIDKSIAIFLYFPFFALWGLDAYFFWQEKIFIGLYKKVVEQHIPSEFLTTSTLDIEAPRFMIIFFSKTLVVFHGVVGIVVFLRVTAFF